MHLRRIFPLAALLLALLVQPTRAQLAPSPDATPAESGGANTRAQPSQTQQSTFQITANLVNLYFLVRGPHNQPVPNLTEKDCTIDEDKVRQTLSSFTAHSDQPLTLGILLDTSLSQQRVLPTEQQAAAAFVHRILRSKDEAFLIGFDVDVTMLSDLTASPSNLKRAIDNAHINSASGNYANGTIPSIGTPKGTLLYDAIYLAANEKLRQETGRKALILLTDGEDEGSETRLQVAIEAAQKANAIVYVLLIQDSGTYGISADYNAGPMRKLTQATGGQLFKIGSNGRKMQAAFEEIESEMRAQYQATYTPTNSKRDGTYRHIEIACQQNGKPLHVQARQGYYAESR